MENASKALIIAGAILLSILIISLGLMVYNNAKSAVGSADLSEAEIQAFNAKFTSYVGDNITGSQVNALIQQVITSNQSNINSKSGNYVTLTFTNLNGNEKTISVTNDVQNTSDNGIFQAATGKRYKVEATYSATTGLITAMSALAQ